MRLVRAIRVIALEEHDERAGVPCVRDVHVRGLVVDVELRIPETVERSSLEGDVVELAPAAS